MNFIQHDLGFRRAGELVEVTLRGSAANVLLLDPSNLSAFKAGRRHRYYGGLAKRSPLTIAIPRAGRWHVVIHLGGLRGNVRSGVRVLPGALPPVHSSAAPELIEIRDALEEQSSEATGEADAGREYDVFVSYAHTDANEVAGPEPYWV